MSTHLFTAHVWGHKENTSHREMTIMTYSSPLHLSSSHALFVTIAPLSLNMMEMFAVYVALYISCTTDTEQWDTHHMMVVAIPHKGDCKRSTLPSQQNGSWTYLFQIKLQWRQRPAYMQNYSCISLMIM